MNRAKASKKMIIIQSKLLKVICLFEAAVSAVVLMTKTQASAQTTDACHCGTGLGSAWLSMASARSVVGKGSPAFWLLWRLRCSQLLKKIHYRN